MNALEVIKQCLVNLDRECVKLHVKMALDSGITASTIVLSSMSKAMEEVGKLYETGEYFIAELLEAASIFKEIMGILRPRIAEEVSALKHARRARIVIGTVKDDIHDVGKSLVSVMLEAAGHEVVDLGVDVPVERFVEACEKYKPDVLAMSALLTTTAKYMKAVIDELKKRGIRDKVKIVVGGAAVTEDFAREIGADGWAPNAVEAVKLVNRLIGQVPGNTG
ncbi:MAG: corrinoid protein [Desulfurococcaceae archaeon]